MIKCSIITAVYNSHDTLPKFLLALSVQTEKDFELIISDDGSEYGCEAVISTYQPLFNHPITYVSHERNGIQKTKALNRGAFASESNYLLFIDPDCLAAPNWVETHLKEREPNKYLIGRRTDYKNDNITPYLDDEFIISGKFSKLSFFYILNYLLLNIKHFKQMLVTKNKFLLHLLHLNTSNYLWGCNFSCWKSDLFKVNGWDNDFKGLGAEDAELDIRFKNMGLQPKSIRFITNVFHIFHKTRKNDDWLGYLRKQIEKKQVRAENGLDALLDEQKELSHEFSTILKKDQIGLFNKKPHIIQ